jgi:hypothetical protein
VLQLGLPKSIQVGFGDETSLLSLVQESRGWLGKGRWARLWRAGEVELGRQVDLLIISICIHVQQHQSKGIAEVTEGRSTEI